MRYDAFDTVYDDEENAFDRDLKYFKTSHCHERLMWEHNIIQSEYTLRM